MPSVFRRTFYEIRQAVCGLPSSAFLDLTERCEYACRMCRFWSDGDHDTARELDTAATVALLREVRELGVRRLRIVGGEPFLRDDLLEVIAAARRLGFHVNVVTNGTRQTGDVPRRIVESGLDGIRYSVDGVGETHDRMRGRRGAFAAVERAIVDLIAAKRAARSRTPELQVFTLVSTLNPDGVRQVGEWLARFDEPIRHFHGPLAESTPEVVRSSVWEGLTMADGLHLPFGATLRPATPAPPTRAVRLARVAARFGARPHCPEAHHLHLDPFGRVKFCALFSTAAFGSWPKRSLREIWFSRRHLRFLHRVRTDPFAMCVQVCGLHQQEFEGNLPQLLRHLVLGAIPSPLEGRSPRDPRFVHDVEEPPLPPRRPTGIRPTSEPRPH